MLFADPGGSPSPDDVIEQFLSVLTARPAADHDRVKSAGPYIATALGGDLRHYWVLDDPPSPGSVLAEEATAGRTLPEQEWVELLRRRLRELVATGVDAAFLVRSLAHYVTDWYRDLANIGTMTDERRGRVRQLMLEDAADPERLENYRRRRAARDPEYATKSLDEVASDLRQMAERVTPVSPEEAARNWAMLDAWQRDVAVVLATD
jgi:hypothetical protein